jgi:hypothetical protein
VLTIYLADNINLDKPEEEQTAQERSLIPRIGRLNPYWGEKKRPRSTRPAKGT